MFFYTLAVLSCVGCTSDESGASSEVGGTAGMNGTSGSPASGGDAGSSGVGSAGRASSGAGSFAGGSGGGIAGGSGTGNAGTSGLGGGSETTGGASGTSSTGASGGIAGSASGPTAGGGNGGAAAGGRGGSTTGTGGKGTFPTTPPVPDTSSRVPVSRPGNGYRVDPNMPYGPEPSQRLDVIYPTDAGPTGTRVLPVVLMFHGGAWVHSYTNNYGSGKDHMSTFFDRFLAHGFLVCNAEYRVNDMPPVDGAPAPAAVEDALLAAKWCWDYMDYYKGDRSKFVVTGASAGGHLALMVGMTTPAAMLGPTSPGDFRIAAIVDGYGPADIEAEIDAVARGWIPPNLPNRAAVARLVNPMTYVRADAPPMICVQGQNDNTAPVRDSQRLVTALVAAGADASIHLVPGQGHGYTTTASGWPDAEKAMFDWLTARGIGR